MWPCEGLRFLPRPLSTPEPLRGGRTEVPGVSEEGISTPLRAPCCLVMAFHPLSCPFNAPWCLVMPFHSLSFLPVTVGGPAATLRKGTGVRYMAPFHEQGTNICSFLWITRGGYPQILHSHAPWSLHPAPRHVTEVLQTPLRPGESSPRPPLMLQLCYGDPATRPPDQGKHAPHPYPVRVCYNCLAPDQGLCPQ